MLFVIGACQLAALSTGCAMGFPMALLLQLREENSVIKLNLDSASWIGSIHGLAGILSIFISTLMQWKGRKSAFMVGSIVMILGWAVAYNANSVTIILLSETFHGCAINALSTVSYLSISEMTLPKYRNVSVQSCSIINGLGISISGILARLIHWKTICLILCVPGIIALCFLSLWPESPPWLAFQGRFNECEIAFRQLRSKDDPSMKELEELIAAQRENFTSEKKHKLSLALFWNKMRRRDFYLPTIHMFLLLNLTYWTGSAVFVINSLELMQKTTRNEKAIFVSGIILNVASFVGLCTSNVLSKYFKNIFIILSTAASAAVCLIGLTIVNLLQRFDILSKDSLVGLFFIIVYVAIAGLGMLSVLFTVTSEIMPVKYRGIGGAMYIIFNSILYSSSLKLSPYLFFYIGISGTLLLFTSNALVSGLLIWKFVPETKNRTLQEIEDFYTYGKFVDSRLKFHNDVEPFVAGL